MQKAKLYPTLDPLFLTLGECQALFWLWHSLTCRPRGEVAVSMKQDSRSEFLP